MKHVYGHEGWVCAGNLMGMCGQSNASFMSIHMGMCGQSNPMPQPPLVCVECVNGVSVHHVCEWSVGASHVHKPLHKTRIMCLLPLTLHSTSPACRATVLPSPVHRLSSSFRVPPVCVCVCVYMCVCMCVYVCECVCVSECVCAVCVRERLCV